MVCGGVYSHDCSKKRCSEDIGKGEQIQTRGLVVEKPRKAQTNEKLKEKKYLHKRSSRDTDDERWRGKVSGRK